MNIHGPAPVRGRLRVPTDKSISHRSMIFSALAAGESELTDVLESKDVLSTRDCLMSMGVQIERLSPGRYTVGGRPAGGFKEPEAVLDCGNSGTSARLLMGFVAPLGLTCVFTGDEYLCRRPMERVITPLSAAGAVFLGRNSSTCLPLAIKGGHLRPMEYRLPVASAQVKSCLLLAALSSEGTWVIDEPEPTRDHTERMLRGAGVQIDRDGTRIVMKGPQVPRSGAIRVVGDISSAAFFLVAGLLMAQDEVVIEGVNLNPTRTGILDVIKEMGGDLRIEPQQDVCGEPQGILRVRRSELKGTRIAGATIPRLIDELPVLAVLASLARGRTEIRDAAELRKKECDRIRAVAVELPRLGANIREEPDGWTIDGVGELRGAQVSSHADHRIAMALAVAGLAATGVTRIAGANCVDISYPAFWDDLKQLAGDRIQDSPPL